MGLNNPFTTFYWFEYIIIVNMMLFKPSCGRLTARCLLVNRVNASATRTLYTAQTLAIEAPGDKNASLEKLNFYQRVYIFTCDDCEQRYKTFSEVPMYIKPGSVDWPDNLIGKTNIAIFLHVAFWGASSTPCTSARRLEVA